MFNTMEIDMAALWSKTKEGQSGLRRDAKRGIHKGKAKRKKSLLS